MDGVVLFRKKLERSLGTIKETVLEYQDPTMVFSAKLILKGKSIKVAKFKGSTL